ncbi:MAG: peptide chain release factor N(5)-glutamine methyltransferase [Acidobacteria bacterium]|nr:peptide chain release factor N(5)-glutamine methyltransferase [Acidobacteriota bacterium]MCI0720896.1 peptide chain release factor N(5)-glutamine methyltransferase [Acidobacteriota bacterium]
MKIHEAIVLATERLEEAAVPGARLNAERLLAFELGQDRSYLLSHFQELITDSCLESFCARIECRRRGTPLQYLLGRQEFRGLEFEVTPDVLIPRPETELLVETALERFPIGEPRIADVGTGSGCIAVAVANAMLGARLFATDLSEAALKIARRNASRHSVSERIQFLQGDLLLPLEPLDLEEKLDCVLSNPPYVAERDLPALQKEVREWEPRMALVGGPSGLDIYKRLLPQALRFLKPGGTLIMEIGYNMQATITGLFDASWNLEAMREDFSGIPRIVAARKQ